VWVERVASLDAAAVPGLLACLDSNDTRACDNALTALNCLVQRWQDDPQRLFDLANRMGERFLVASVPGQQRLLELTAKLVAHTSASLLPPARDLLGAAARATDHGVRAQGLGLAAVLLEKAPAGAVRDVCRQWVRVGLGDGEAGNRVRAVQLTLKPGLKDDEDLLALVVPLLQDPVAAVRRAALLRVGGGARGIAEGGLLPPRHAPGEGA